MRWKLSMNVSLTSELEQYVREKVDSGMYYSASEVIREGLRLLKQREQLQSKRITSGIEIELLEMANDPQIQRELATIELEFSTTLMDGLQG